MRLTEQEKKTLRKQGYNASEMKQLQMAASRCDYEDEKGNCVDAEDVIEWLGREEWLSGVARAAFHWTSVRDNNGRTICFDCSNMFR